MDSIGVGELKSDFSNILHEIQERGKKYIIEYGKRHKKVAMIIPYDKRLEEQENRTFGLLQGIGSFKLHDDFVMSDEELLGL